MIGVVLWSDAPLQKAVIWCDDQGGLAFFKNKTGNECPELNPGDWVEFDLTLSGNFRIAENLTLVMEQGSPDLPERLSASGEVCGATLAKPEENGTVVPFPPRSEARRNKQAPLQVRRG